MIQFHNGHKFEFGTASGAMAFRGNGWWFEQPYRWFGFLRPKEFTIIIKTLTFEPRKGNLRWYAPWRAVRFYKNSVVNAVGLTNRGYEWWLKEPYNYIKRKGYEVIVSIAPNNINEAKIMANAFNKVDIVGLQLNVSCPNVEHDNTIKICEISDAILRLTKHPLVIKLAYQDDYLTVCKELDGKVSAFELINTIPFQIVFPGNKSPLSSYGYQGGVSGKSIISYARKALIDVKKVGIRTPIISGGGIDSLKELLIRKSCGAEGFVFGSVFIRKPYLPNRIISEFKCKMYCT